MVEGDAETAAGEGEKGGQESGGGGGPATKATAHVAGAVGTESRGGDSGKAPAGAQASGWSGGPTGRQAQHAERGGETDEGNKTQEEKEEAVS